jgi:hypothetical protein
MIVSNLNKHSSTWCSQSPFCGKASEDSNAHLQHFLEICNTFTIQGVTQDAVRPRLFPFSLLGKAKQWFYFDKETVSTWEKCSNAFLAKFFPWVKPMPFGTSSLGFSNSQMRPSPRHGNACRIISLHAPITAWRSGSSSKLLSWIDLLSPRAYRCGC